MRCPKFPKLVKNEDLVSFYKLRGSLIRDTKLTCYVIKTLSTGSEIKL